MGDIKPCPVRGFLGACLPDMPSVHLFGSLVNYVCRCMVPHVSHAPFHIDLSFYLIPFLESEIRVGLMNYDAVYALGIHHVRHIIIRNKGTMVCRLTAASRIK